MAFLGPPQHLEHEDQIREGPSERQELLEDVGGDVVGEVGDHLDLLALLDVVPEQLRDGLFRVELEDVLVDQPESRDLSTWFSISELHNHWFDGSCDEQYVDVYCHHHHHHHHSAVLSLLALSAGDTRTPCRIEISNIIYRVELARRYS